MTIIVIATILLAHSLVAVKMDSLARAVSARISMNAKKVWTIVTKTPAARTKKADSNADVSQVSLEMVSIAMMLTNVCSVIMTVARTHNALMLKEHIAANVFLVILVTVLSVLMLMSVRRVCHHVINGLFVIIHLDHFIEPASLVSRWMLIEIVLT